MERILFKTLHNRKKQFLLGINLMKDIFERNLSELRVEICKVFSKESIVNLFLTVLFYLNKRLKERHRSGIDVLHVNIWWEKIGPELCRGVCQSVRKLRLLATENMCSDAYYLCFVIKCLKGIVSFSHSSDF